MDSSVYSHRKGLGFMWITSSWNVHRNPNILFSNMLLAILFSSSHLLILEAANCETKVAGKALCVCKKKKLSLWGSILQSFLLQSFPWPCVCPCACPRTWVPVCYKWLCPFSPGSVRMSVCTMFSSALDWKLEKLKAFRTVSKKKKINNVHI